MTGVLYRSRSWADQVENVITVILGEVVGVKGPLRVKAIGLEEKHLSHRRSCGDKEEIRWVRRSSLFLTRIS